MELRNSATDNPLMKDFVLCTFVGLFNAQTATLFTQKSQTA